MLTADLNNAAVSFARSLKSAAVVARYWEARHSFESDVQLARSRDSLNRAAQSFREKQSAGTLSERDINRVRVLQAKLNLHPRAVELLSAQQEMVELLQECNQQMTEVLGIDFASAGVPAGCC